LISFKSFSVPTDIIDTAMTSGVFETYSQWDILPTWLKEALCSALQQADERARKGALAEIVSMRLNAMLGVSLQVDGATARISVFFGQGLVFASLWLAEEIYARSVRGDGIVIHNSQGLWNVLIRGFAFR
jgi:hypothetical protein